VDSDQTIVAAAQRMLRHRISGLPVVDAGGALVGIITETDIFKALVDLSGASSGNTSLAFQLEDRPGSIKEVADVIRAHGGQLESILTSNTLAKTGFRRVYLRIRDLPSDQMRALESELGGRFDLLYLIQEDPSSA
jgi:acetoin utilization protein AcuB